MPIIFVNIQNEFYFFFVQFGGGAKAPCSAKFSFECRYVRGRVVTRVWFENDVSVGWFAVHFGTEVAIAVFFDEDVEKSDFAIFFFFSGEFESWMNGVEAIVEVGCWVCAGVVVA